MPGMFVDWCSLSHPEAAHRVMHGGENFHGLFARIIAYEFFVDFEDAFELAIEDFARECA